MPAHEQGEETMYLLEQSHLVLLQLLLEAKVRTDIGTDNPGGSQTFLPAEVGHSHKVSHQDGGAAGNTSQAVIAEGLKTRRAHSDKVHSGGGRAQEEQPQFSCLASSTSCMECISQPCTNTL